MYVRVHLYSLMIHIVYKNLFWWFYFMCFKFFLSKLSFGFNVKSI